MSLDKVTEAGELFIGGWVEKFSSSEQGQKIWYVLLYDYSIFTLRRYELLKKANISHIVSVISQNIEPELVKNYKHLGLNIDDVEYEDILQYFPSSNEFIRQGLQDGGGVFVHW